MGANERMIRSFVALPLPVVWREPLAELQRRLAVSLDGVRWARPENIHLTLAFFGPQPEEALDKIAATMLSVTSLSAPFTVRSAGLGVFPNERRSRVVWLGLEPPQPLVELQRVLTHGWRHTGIAGETRKFRPHLTLGRLRQSRPIARELLTRFAAETKVDWRVDRVVLYESRLKPTGAEHLSRRVALLGG